jgi:hypothetical protein
MTHTATRILAVNHTPLSELSVKGLIPLDRTLTAFPTAVPTAAQQKAAHEGAHCPPP